MSCEKEIPVNVLVPLLSAAAMIKRCAMDLLGGGMTEPESRLGVMEIFMAMPPILPE